MIRPNKPVAVVGLLLLTEAALFYAIPKDERVPLSRPLKEFPTQVAGWRMTQELPVDAEVEALLKADDTLDRSYLDTTSGQTVSLSIGFFKSQRAGVSPHSPKVCLPGSGWVATKSEKIGLSVPGRSVPIRINRYVVAQGDREAVVLYWFQSHGRVVAGEYAAKLFLMLDSLRYRRSDASLVRVVVPVVDGRQDVAERTASRFVQGVFESIRRFLPA